MTAALAWGIGPDGGLVFASSMVGVDPRDRPRVTCPECDDVVTIKAGERSIVTPHVAHRSGSACAATSPETAEHFNAKMILAHVLGQRGTLRLLTRCDYGHRVEGDWRAPAWRRAVAEHRVDTRRPDVAVIGEGDVVVGAVEVLHSHRVDRRKASDYAASGVPWVEFRADVVLAWDGQSALALESSDRATKARLLRGCGTCRAMYRPSAAPVGKDALAAQAKAFLAALAKLKRSSADPAEDERRRAEKERDARREAYSRRVKSGAVPSLVVVAAAVVAGGRVALGVVCARAGAVPVVEVVDRPDGADVAMMAAELAMRLVEEKARRPVTLCLLHPSAPSLIVDPPAATDALRCRVAEALARTGSVAVMPYAHRLGAEWFVVVRSACDAAIRRDGADP